MRDQQLPKPTPGPVSVRSDVKAYVRSDQKVVLQDLRCGKHYRLGPTEYRFYVQLTQGLSPLEAHRCATREDPSWTEASSQALLNWLSSRGLITKAGTQFCDVAPAEHPLARRLNPLFARFSLGSPERFFSWLELGCRPLFRPVFGWVLAIASCLALSILLTFRNELQIAFKDLLTPWRAANLTMVWLLLKLVHETGHGVACHHWGGRVKDWGIALLFGMPIPYVDLSESCRFPARGQRTIVALAGVLAEGVFATAAVLLWQLSGSEILGQFVADLVLAFALGACLFNLNPLMKFDGYYVMSEWLGIDNLYARGANYASSLLQRVLLGRMAPESAYTPLAVRCYGIASFAWRTLAIAGLLVSAVTLWQGVGLVLAIWALGLWWSTPTMNLLRKLQSEGRTYALQLLGLSLRPIGLLLLCACGVFWMPLPVEQQGHALVEYDPPAIVRSPSTGFVESVHVADGDRVEKGDLLFALRNDELDLAVASLKLELARCQLAIRAALVQQDAELLQAWKSQQAGLLEQFHEVEALRESLTIKAPASGVVSAPRLQHLLGTYVEQGVELATLGDQQAKRLRLLVQQELAADLHPGAPFRYLSAGGVKGATTVSEVSPRSSTDTRDLILGANHGGALPVKMTRNGKPQFCSPHTEILATLSPNASKSLRVNQRVSVAFGSRRSLGEWLMQVIAG